MKRSYRSGDPRRRSTTGMLYLGLVLFLALAAVTIGEVRDEWRLATARSRSEAVFDLVQTATPIRPTGTPGAVAWLDLQVKRYGSRRLSGVERAMYQELVSFSGSSVPAFMEPIRSAMVQPRLDGVDATGFELLSVRDAAGESPAAGEPDSMQFRVQSFLAMAPENGADPRFVLTRRRVLGADRVPAEVLSREAETSDRFLRHALPYLAAIAEHLESGPSLPAIAGRQLRQVRIYALAEDGTFVSLPKASGDEAERRRTMLWEGRQFRRQPMSPTFVSNEFFFRFDFGRAAARPAAQASYSGLYLDLAGHGLVTTVTLPVADPATGFLAVLAVDVAFEIDWQDFARGLENPQIARLVEVPGATAGSWRPWTEIRRALDPQAADPALDRVLQELADREQSAGYTAAAGSLYHAVVDGLGAAAAFQVSAERWLVVLFPELPSRFPRLAMTLLAVLGLSLMAGFEVNRRRAVEARVKAEGELREKENLLNSMRVPLIVVDPNSDATVYGNDAALALGLVPGKRIGDIVATARGREHYDRMQHLSSETRRAYGVPIEVRTPKGGIETRHAVFRSAAVAAPIETLNADQRHRLGVLFVLEPEADLAIYNQDLETRCRDDERRRLAGILSHGVDTLARVLSYRLQHAAGDDPLAAWLADYLQRRLRVTGWLLDHWHAEPPLGPDTTVEAGQARATLERFREVFATAQREAELRSRLHWDNGVLAEDPGDGVFDLELHWPDNIFFTSPIRGGFGLFLEEVLVNAIRHGRPGGRPRVTVAHDPVRRELRFEVVNPAIAGDRDPQDLEAYGGRRLLERMAHLFGWHELDLAHHEGTFRAGWRVRVGERVGPCEVD